MASSESLTKQFRLTFAKAFPASLAGKAARSEELELEEFGASKMSLLARKLTEIGTKLSPLHMGQLNNGQQTYLYGQSVWLRYHNPFKRTGQRKCCTLFSQLLSIIFVISAVWLQIATILQFLHDYLLSKSRLDLKALTSSSTMPTVPLVGYQKVQLHCVAQNGSLPCATATNEHNLLLIIDRLLNLIGAATPSVSTLTLFSYTSSIGLFYCLYLLVFVERNANIRLDGLSFLYNPLDERKRTKQELIDLMAIISEECDKYTRFSFSSPSRLKFDGESRSYASRAHEETVVVREILATINKEAMFQLDVHKLFCLKLLISRHQQLSWFVMAILCQLMTALSVALLLIEVVLRTESRLKQTKCDLMIPGSVHMEQHVHLNPILSNDELLAYQNYDESWPSYVLLIINEAPKTFSLLKTSFVYTLNGAIICILFCWQAQYYVAFVTGFTYSDIWLKQIGCQMQACIDLVGLLTTFEQSLEHHFSDSTSANRLKLGLLTRRLQLAIMTTYLNFELYRRSQLNFLKYVNIVASYTIAGVSALIGSSVIISLVVRSVSGTVLVILVSYFLIVSDTFLILCARMSSRMSDFLKEMSRFLGQVSANSALNRSFIIELWRKQLLETRDLNHMFTAKVFGLTLSQSNLITYNIYVICVWVLISFPIFAAMQGAGSSASSTRHQQGQLLSNFQANKTTNIKFRLS